MYITKIKYTDYNDVEREEEFRFALNRAEIVKYMTTNGDYTLDSILKRIVSERNGKKIMEMFEDLIKRSYGRVSIDGRKFEKNEEIWNDFAQSEAYSVFFMDIISDAKKAAEFVNGILPKDLSDEVTKIMAENPDGIPDELKDYLPSK